MSDKYDDPENEAQWCLKMRDHVADYLDREGVPHGQIGELPAWHVSPYVSIWAVECAEHADCLRWWVICGDMPTDYLSADKINDPREAMKSFSDRWKEVASYMHQGKTHPSFVVGKPEQWKELASLLEARASTLSEWAEDDSIWEGILP